MKKGFPRPKVFLLLPLLFLSLTGASCAHHNPTDHSSSEPQIFDVYFSGTQSTNWSANYTFACAITEQGGGAENLSFVTPDAYRFETNTTSKSYPTIAIPLQEVVTRDGDLSYSFKYDPKCHPTPVAKGTGGDGPPIGPKDCGKRIWTQLASIQSDGSGSFVISTPAGLGDSNSASDPNERQNNAFHNCPKEMESPFFRGKKQLQISLPAAELADGTKLAISRSGTDSTGISQSGAAVGSVDVDWTLTLCRTTSNSGFQAAVEAVKRELSKSPTFQRLLAQHPDLPIANASLPKGTLGYSSYGRSRDAAGHITFKQSIQLDWSQLRNGYDLLGDLAHETGHVQDLGTKQFGPHEAAAFLGESDEAFAEYQALIWQAELDANQFALKVLKEVRQADHSIAPCIDAFLRSGAIPPLTDLAKGDINQAKSDIKRAYVVKEQDFLRDQSTFEDFPKTYPEIQRAVDKVDLKQLVQAWR
jgi:hypothetical protein